MKRFGTSCLIPVVVILSCAASCRTEQASPDMIPVISKALYDSSSVWFGSLRSYTENTEKLPIGLITSEIEELAVMEEFLTADYFDNITGCETPDGICDFAGEKFHLLLDYADSPYNGYFRDSTGFALLREITVKNCLRMLGDEYYIIPEDELATGVRDPVKMLVNVSDATGVFCQEDIDTLISLGHLPVIAASLVSSGINAVVSRMKHGDGFAIGVLSSYDLYSTGLYENMIRKAMNDAGCGDKVQIFQQMSQSLEEAVEGDVNYILPFAWCVRSDYRGPVPGTGENDIDLNMMDRYGFDRANHSLLCSYNGKTCTEMQLNSVGNYARFHLVTLIEKHRRSGSRIPIRAIILGNRCDSFVIDTLKAVVSELYDFRRDGQYIYRNSISPDLEFIDPAECLVKDCYRILRSSRKLAFNTTRTELTPFMIIPSPKVQASFVDTLTGSFSDDFKYGRIPGGDEEYEKMVPFSLRYVSPAHFRFTENLFPESTRQLRKKLY